LFTFQEKIGLVPDETLKGRFVKVTAVMDAGEKGDEIKSREWNENDHPRASDGRFGSVAGTHGAVSSKPKKPDAVGELHREHGTGRTEQRKVNGLESLDAGLSHSEIAQLKPHLPHFLYEKLTSPSAQNVDAMADISAMGSYNVTPPRPVHRIPGTLATDEEIAEVREALDKAGVGLEAGTHYAVDLLDALGLVAGFDPNPPPAVLLRKNPTIYELAHECLHAVHRSMLGAKNYRQTTHYEKEAFVYRGLASFFKSGVLNDAEIDHAKWYVNHVFNDFESHFRGK